MSIKHVNKYYDQICEQYQEMLDNLKELAIEAEKGLIEPERLDRLQEQVAPIKQNYERWTYMMFLLRQPNRKDKVSRYKKQNMKLLETLSADNSLEAIIEENNEAMKKVGT